MQNKNSNNKPQRQSENQQQQQAQNAPMNQENQSCGSADQSCGTDKAYKNDKSANQNNSNNEKSFFKQDPNNQKGTDASRNETIGTFSSVTNNATNKDSSSTKYDNMGKAIQNPSEADQEEKDDSSVGVGSVN